ncbi:MAG: hypothetical protein JWP15_2348 [Alphaproteobacteria bacterium]|nr:hypothetical protein [Alphaproteobacteria bacterium]
MRRLFGGVWGQPHGDSVGTLDCDDSVPGCDLARRVVNLLFHANKKSSEPIEFRDLGISSPGVSEAGTASRA